MSLINKVFILGGVLAFCLIIYGLFGQHIDKFIASIKKKLHKYQGNRFVLIVCLIFLVILGYFYWFQIRPSLVRKNCLELIRKEFKDKKYYGYTTKGANNRYRVCFTEYGLKPEDLF